MNITVFLLKNFIFILNSSLFMCSNLGLFAETWGLSTENKYLFVKALLVIPFFNKNVNMHTILFVTEIKSYCKIKF